MAYLAEPVLVVSPAAAPRDVIIDAASGRVQLGAPSPIVHGDEGKIDRIEAERRELEAERIKESERVVTGLENEDLNALLRVFDKQVHHVQIRAPPNERPELKHLDLVPSPDEEFDIDKLRSNLERFYASVIVGLFRCIRELQRIRGWQEGGSRTAITLLIYCLAWNYNLIITSFLLFLSTLILAPATRELCFRAPQHNKEGIDSCSKLTDHGDEAGVGPAATEAAANQWVKSMQGLLKSIASPTGGGEGADKIGKLVSEEVNGVMVQDMRREQALDGGNEDEPVDKKALTIEQYGKPAMRIIGGLADKWERIANSLNPTPPFLLEPHRVKVFYLLVAPILVLSTIISERVFSRMFGLLFGLFLFGKPITGRAVAKLDIMIPHWRERLILEYNILSDVPTNSQLIIRLLRDAEHKRRPLSLPDDDDDDDDDEEEDESEEGDIKSKMGYKIRSMKTKVNSGLRSKVRQAWDKAGSVKEEGFARITGHKKVDYKSKAESTLDKLNVPVEGKRAKALLDRLPTAPDESSPDNPSRFYVYHVNHGPGHLIIHPPTIPVEDTESFTSARITLTTIRRVPASSNVSLETEVEPSKGHLTISINDIISIKKEGLRLPGRILTSWALDAEGAGGTGMELKIVRRGTPGEGVGVINSDGRKTTQGKVETIRLKGIVRRNELFDRLLSLGEQQWETL